MQTDADLVIRAARGENEAVDLIYRRYYSRIYNFAYRLDGNADNAADIAQVAFVKALPRLRHLRDGQALLGWLYRIVVNVVRDRSRRAERKPWVSFASLWRHRDSGCDDGIEPVEFADHSLNPERVVGSQMRDAALYDAIAKLPLEHREAILLHHVLQVDLKQASEILGIPEGTMKSRLSRARNQLRHQLSEWLDDGGDTK